MHIQYTTWKVRLPMLTTYSTNRLELRILPAIYSKNILEFYNRNKDFLEPLEPERSPNFYSETYQISNLNCEYNAFVKGVYARYWLSEKDAPEKIIGSVCFSDFKKGAFYSCMIGYKLDQMYCNKGYMSEALIKLIPHACNDFSLHRINAIVMPDNTPSINLLERLNFIREGYLHSCAQINGKWKDHLLYSYINPE